MEQVNRAKPTPNTPFRNQKLFSDKIHKRMLKAIKEILDYCDKFEIIEGQNETILYKDVNYYYWNLSRVIFHLQQIVIDIGKNCPNPNSLQNVLDELNKCTSSIQESLKLEPKKIKTKLKTYVVSVGFQVEQLVKIIQTDDLHEFKQRILDCQLDLVIFTEKLKIGLKICNLSPAEIGQYIHELIDTLIKTLYQLKTDHKVVEETFSYYVRRSIQHDQHVADYLVQLVNTGRFTGSLKRIVKNILKLGQGFINNTLDSLESDAPIQKIFAHIEMCHGLTNKGMGEVQKGINDIFNNNFNKKVRNNVNEIMHYIMASGMNTVHSLNRTVEDIII